MQLEIDRSIDRRQQLSAVTLSRYVRMASDLQLYYTVLDGNIIHSFSYYTSINGDYFHGERVVFLVKSRGLDPSV